MQERGDTDSDKNKDFIPDMVPDDMQQGPIAHAPVNMGHVARHARDELHAVHVSETIKQLFIGISRPHPHPPYLEKSCFHSPKWGFY
jgi:hypothetical protein